MISWTIPGTVAGLTGSSSESFSTASSASFSVSTQFSGPFNGQPFADTQQGSGSTTSSEDASGVTIVDQSGGTTRTFSSFAYSSSSQYLGTMDLTPEAQGVPENQYTGPSTVSETGSVTSSSSASGETIQPLTARKATSATSTFESFYEAFSYVGTVPANDEFDLPTEWTYSSGPVQFFPTEASTTTSYLIEFSTRQGTESYTEELEETITLSGLPDTVVQAAPNEILYAIRSVPTTWNGYLAATSLAESGTRLTLSPLLKTIARASMSASSPTSSTQGPSYSAAATFSVGSFSQATITTASYFSFPPQTATRTTASFSLRSSSEIVSRNTFQINFGNGLTTILQTEYFTIPTTARRQIQSQTYTGRATTTSSIQRPSVIEAAVTRQSNYVDSTSFPMGINFAPGTQFEGYSSGTTAHAEGNTSISVPRAVLDAASFFGRTKHRTTGAVVGSQTGGWITANASSQGFIFALYALAGSGRNGQVMLPQTNESRTVDSSQITWTLSTSTTAEQGTTTAATTTSASFGVAGSTSITLDNRPLSVFGGTPGAGQTIVERPGAGVYKDRIDGTTSTFSEGDVSFTSGQGQPLRAWFPIRHIGPLQLGPNLNPITWSEHRNSSIFLPPNTP
jgi:hypothetical protein